MKFIITLKCMTLLIRFKNKMLILSVIKIFIMDVSKCGWANKFHPK